MLVFFTHIFTFPIIFSDIKKFSEDGPSSCSSSVAVTDTYIRMGKPWLNLVLSHYVLFCTDVFKSGKYMNLSTLQTKSIYRSISLESLLDAAEINSTQNLIAPFGGYMQQIRWSAQENFNKKKKKHWNQ